MEHGNLIPLPQLEDTLSLLTVEKRIKELKQEYEDLIEHSQLLQRDRQRLSEQFAAGMKRSQVLQMKLERHILDLQVKQQALEKQGNDLQEFLKNHRLGRG
jgi:hypothetical protein